MDALLSGVDWICESTAAAAVAVLYAAARSVRLVLSLILRGTLAAAGLIFLAPFRLLRRLIAPENAAARCLKLDGPEFEAYVALVLEDNGFRHVEITKGSGDQGVDILAERGGKRYAVQCKNYAGAVGNFAVQEAYAGAQYYDCDAAAVICPGEFTRGAKALAQSTGVLLWDGRKLSRMMRISGRRPHRRAL